MKTVKELKQLSANIAHAIMTYHAAVAENLKELGKPIPVQGDDKDIKGIRLSIEADLELNDCVIGSVKWDENANDVMALCTCWNCHEEDEWMYISDLGDAVDYVLEAIQWPKL